VRPTPHLHPESGATGVSGASSAHIGAAGRVDVLDPAREARFPAEKAQHSAATATIGSEAVMGSGLPSSALEEAIFT
jgi:hypothetical protein